MSSYKFVVFTNPATPKQEREYNDWYDETHLDDVLKVPGFVAAQRFAWTPADGEDTAPPNRYMAIYEIEADDVKTAYANLLTASTSEMVISPALCQDGIFAKFFKPIGPRKIGATP